MKRICREQYEKDFDEMFKLDKKGLMTDIDCYVSNLENSIERLERENKQLKEKLLVAKTNEETFRLEMEDITRALGLAEDTLFDDVKTYARSLKEKLDKYENPE